MKKAINAHPLRIVEATTRGYVTINDGKCFDAERPTSRTRRGRKMTKKSNTLMAQPNTEFCRYKNARIRRLTATECARLQTIPNWYKFRQVNKKGEDVPMSDSAIYKALGNGWTVQAVMTFFSQLPQEWKTDEPASGDYMGCY